MRRKRILTTTCIFVLLSFTATTSTGCNDNDLNKFAQSMVVVSKTIGQIQTDAIAWNNAKLISEDTTRGILEVCVKLDVAGLQINEIVRTMSSFNDTNVTTLNKLLTAMSTSLDPSKLEFILSIEDPVVKQRIEGYFIILRSTISTLQIILVSS
jgi:hypothetical protein